jgi:ferritin
MVSQNIEKALNKQIRIEAESSQIYLSMACWAESKGFEGVAEFMFAQADEERAHMLRLLKYLTERGGKAIISELSKPSVDYTSPKQMFEEVLEHEIFVSNSINDLVSITFEEKDFATNNFLQWYVAEQIEEEATARTILDKINLIGDDKSGFYLFDKDVRSMIAAKPESL